MDVQQNRQQERALVQSALEARACNTSGTCPKCTAAARRAGGAGMHARHAAGSQACLVHVIRLDGVYQVEVPIFCCNACAVTFACPPRTVGCFPDTHASWEVATARGGDALVWWDEGLLKQHEQLLRPLGRVARATRPRRQQRQAPAAVGGATPAGGRRKGGGECQMLPRCILSVALTALHVPLACRGTNVLRFVGPFAMCNAQGGQHLPLTKTW